VAAARLALDQQLDALAAARERQEDRVRLARVALARERLALGRTSPTSQNSPDGATAGCSLVGSRGDAAISARPINFSLDLRGAASVGRPSEIEHGALLASVSIVLKSAFSLPDEPRCLATLPACAKGGFALDARKQPAGARRTRKPSTGRPRGSRPAALFAPAV
jgi:hypothetical protein